jgi:hypothetical protein
MSASPGEAGDLPVSRNSSCDNTEVGLGGMTDWLAGDTAAGASPG